jgi:ligand-binding sensor domain-containing protein
MQSPRHMVGALRVTIMMRPVIFRLIFLGAATLLAPPEHLSTQTFPFHAYTTQEGLASDNVTALFQDSKGFLWIGTDNGLNIYNGAGFRTITMADGLPNSYVTAISESRKFPGTIWVATIAGGLVKIVGDSIHAFSVGGNNIGSVQEDVTGRVWCTTSDSLYFMVDDSLLVFNGIPAVHEIHLLAESTLVASDDRALHLISPHSLAHIRLAPPLQPHETIAASTVDEHQTIWLALTSGSVMAVGSDGTVRLRRHVGFTISQNIPSQLTSDHAGRLWLTTPSSLISIATDTSRDRSFSDRRVTGEFGPLLVDREDILWTGGPGRGLLKIADRRLQHISIDGIQTGAFNHVASMDSSGHIWIVTKRGLEEVIRGSPGEWTSHHHNFPTPSGNFGYVLVDPLGRLWTGGYGTPQYDWYAIRHNSPGASTLEHGEVIEPSVFRGARAGFTFSIDQHGRAWCTLDTGVGLVDSRSRTLIAFFGTAAGLPSDFPRALLFDRKGNLWSGSWSTGLSRLMKGATRFETFTDFAGIRGAGVRSLLEDVDGNLWIGTRFAGLVRYKDGAFQTITVRDGLVSNAVWSLAETPGRIWLATDVGVQSVDKRTLKPFHPHNDLLVGRVYSIGAYKGEYIWCITAHDVVVFESPEGIPRKDPAPIFITSFSASGTRLDRNAHNRLSYDRNTCVFEFVGVSFRDERAVTYQYRMLGIDSVWSEPAPQRSVTYATLDPGSYIFEVRAITGDGIISATPATVAFVVVPPFWQRWWFIVLCACIGTTILFVLYRYRIMRLVEMERLRTRIASDLHDDVGTNLSSIMIASQIMERKFPLSDEERTQLGQLRTTAARTQDMLKDIVWLLNPKNDSLDDFALKLKEIAVRILQDLPLTFHASGGDELERVDLEFKRHVVMIFKESLHNVVKHARASLVAIDVTFARGVFTMSIHDNGKGFDPETSDGGNGLNNLRMRARIIGGSVEILSRPGEGSTIRLSASITHMRSGGGWKRSVRSRTP